MKLLDFQNGKKTYAVIIIGIALGVAQQQGWHIPGWVDWGLTFLGMGALRHAVTTSSAKTAADIADMAKLILENVTVPDPNEGTTGATVKTDFVHTEYLPPLK